MKPDTQSDHHQLPLATIENATPEERRDIRRWYSRQLRRRHSLWAQFVRSLTLRFTLITALLVPSIATAKDCGPYAVSVALKHMGHDVTFQEVAEDFLGCDSGTSAPCLVEYLAPFCGAAAHNRGTVEDLVSQIDRGKPVICSVDTGGPLHWVLVTDYEDPRGRIWSWEIYDTFWGRSGRATLSHSRFVNLWRNPAAHGGTNYWIELAPQRSGQLPFETATVDLLGSMINNYQTGSAQRKPMTLLRAVTETPFALAAVLIYHRAELLHPLQEHNRCAHLSPLCKVRDLTSTTANRIARVGFFFGHRPLLIPFSPAFFIFLTGIRRQGATDA